MSRSILKKLSIEGEILENIKKEQKLLSMEVFCFFIQPNLKGHKVVLFKMIRSVTKIYIF